MGLRDEGAGDEDALFLSTGELAEGDFGEVAGIGTFEALEGELFFVLGVEAAWAGAGVGAHECDFEAIEEEERVEAFVLGDVADGGIGVVGMGEGDSSLEGWEDTGERFEEGGFSGAIGAEEGGETTFGEGEVEVLEDGVVRVAHCDLVD